MSRSKALAPGAGEVAPKLAAVRSDIDRIDEALLDLIERRLAAARAVAALKQDGGDALLLHPDRERQVLDRLGRRAVTLDPDAIETLWRELMGLSLQLQQRTEIVIHADQQPVLVTDQARRRFGGAAPIVVAGSPEDALDRARGHDAIAVIELSPLSSWWAGLFEDERLVIFDSLRDAGRVSALAVARIAPDRLAPGLAFPILPEATLRQRIAAGEAIQPLAVSGHLRLCLSEEDAR